jgi:hypothetical protein
MTRSRATSVKQMQALRLVLQLVLVYAFAVAMIVSPLKQVPAFDHQTAWCVSSSGGEASPRPAQTPSHQQSEACCLLFCGQVAAFLAPHSDVFAVLSGAYFLRPLIDGISGQHVFPPAAFANPRAPPTVL